VDPETFNLDELFPIIRTPDFWAPIPWLDIVGGVSMWRFRVGYIRNPHEVTVRIQMEVPGASPISDRLNSVFSTTCFNTRDLQRYGIEYARQKVMMFIRSLAEHEVLESLQVGGQPFFKEEVDRLHGNTP